MPAIQFSGLSSGLDTDAIIAALSGVERIPIQRMQADNGDLGDKKKVLDSLSSALSNLKTKGEALGEVKNVLSYKGTSSNANVAKLTTSGDAVRGDFKLVVNQLAQSQRNYSKEFASKDDSLTAVDTTFSITIAGEQKDIEVKAGTTLSQLTEQINSTGQKVTAGLMYTGSGYRLQISGNETGLANAVTFGEGGLDLQLASNQVQDAEDASFEIDDFPITSASNIVTDVLPGVSLELLGKTDVGSSETLSIKPDKDAVKAKIKSFVDAYNGVMSIVNAQVGEGKGNNTLNGDATVRSIEQQLGSLVSSEIPGMTGTNGQPMALTGIGIRTNRDGTLQLNDDDLQTAFSSGFESIARYFAGDKSAGVKGISGLIADTVKGFVDGKTSIIGARKAGIDQTIKTNEERITAHETYVKAYEDQLRAQYTALESAMSQMKTQGNYLAQFLR